jgi:hypothetical protein
MFAEGVFGPSAATLYAATSLRKTSQCLGCGTRVPARMREQAARDKPVALAIWLSE